MTRSKGWVTAIASAAVVVSGLLWLEDAGQARQGGVPPARVLAQPISAPGIDNGHFDDGLPREPRGRVQPRVERADRSAASQHAWVPGRVIVKFRGGTTAAERADAAAQAGASAVRRPDHANFELLDISTSADAEAVARELSARPDVEYAQAAYRVRPYHRPNDPLFNQQWNLAALRMEDAWDINRGASSSIIVAVLDTGLAYRDVMFTFDAPAFRLNGVRYPALGRITVPFAAATDLISPDRIVAPYDFIFDDDSPVDLDGHGTHVAGTIGQLTDNAVGVAGMAFNVRLMPLKVIDGVWDQIFGAPFTGTDDLIARAIRYAVDNGARVLNMSFGRDGPPAPVVADAMRYAVGRGAFIAVAAGNDYENGNPIERHAEIAAEIPGAMAVAAVGPNLNRAFYSGVRPYVEIAAPGGDRRSGGPEGAVLQQTYDAAFTDTFLPPPDRFSAPRFDVFVFTGLQGTSMAAPHVSGLAALLMTQGITSPAAIEEALRQFATDRGAAGRDDEYGFGLINPRATLRGLGLIR